MRLADIYPVSSRSLGELKILLKNVVAMFVLSELLEMSTLNTQALAFLNANLTREKVPDVLADAIRLDSKPIMSHICCIIAQNFSGSYLLRSLFAFDPGTYRRILCF